MWSTTPLLLLRGYIGEGEMKCEWKGTRGTTGRPKGPRSTCTSVIPSPQPPNYQPTRSRQHERGLCGGERSNTVVMFDISSQSKLKLDAPRAFTLASYRNIKSYFTCIEHKKNEYKNQDILTQGLRLDIFYSSCFVEYPLYPIACCLPHLRSSVYDDS